MYSYKKHYSSRNRDKYSLIHDILKAIKYHPGESSTRVSYRITTHEKIIRKYIEQLDKTECIKTITDNRYVKDLRTLSGARQYYEITEKGERLLNLIIAMGDMLSEKFFVIDRRDEVSSRNDFQ